jgi:hypothetical protein
MGAALQGNLRAGEACDCGGSGGTTTTVAAEMARTALKRAAGAHIATPTAWFKIVQGGMHGRTFCSALWYLKLKSK